MLRESFHKDRGEYALLQNAADQDRAATRSFDAFLKAAASIPGVERLSSTPTHFTATPKTNAGLGMGA